MKTKIIVLGIMLFSSSNFALADTEQVNEGHLRAHRDYEEQNLERQRFKLESGIGEDRHDKNHSDSADLPKPEKNSNSRPPFNFDEYKGTYLFGQYQQKKSHKIGSRKTDSKQAKKTSDESAFFPLQVEFQNGSSFIFGPYYPDKPPQWSVKGLYLNQEWDVYPKFDEDISNAPPYSDFDHSSTKPPPPMLKTISKEKRSGDSP